MASGQACVEFSTKSSVALTLGLGSVSRFSRKDLDSVADFILGLDSIKLFQTLTGIQWNKDLVGTGVPILNHQASQKRIQRKCKNANIHKLHRP